MKERSKTMIKIGIIAVGMCDTGSGATNGALMAIMEAMPDVSPNLVQMIQSVPALFIALLPFVYAKLVQSGFSKRKIIVIGGALLVIGGVMPTFLHDSIWMILFWRAVFGAGNGLLLPLASDLVIDFFEGKERNVVQGWASAAFSLSGVIFQLLGGWLGGIHWTYTFLAYAVAILFFIVALICLPEPPRAEKIAEQEGQDVASGKTKTSLGATPMLIIIVFGLFEFFWYVNANNAAVVIQGEGIAAPAMIGTMMSFMSWSALILGIIFGWVLNKIHYKTFIFGFAFGVCGMIINSMADTEPMFTLGIFLIGCAQGTVVPSVIAFLTNHLPYSVGSKAVSAVYIAMGIGGFIQPMAFALIPAIAIGRPAYVAAAIGIVVVALLMWAACKAVSSKYKDRVIGVTEPVYTEE